MSLPFCDEVYFEIMNVVDSSDLKGSRPLDVRYSVVILIINIYDLHSRLFLKVLRLCYCLIGNSRLIQLFFFFSMYTYITPRHEVGVDPKTSGAESTVTKNCANGQSTVLHLLPFRPNVRCDSPNIANFLKLSPVKICNNASVFQIFLYTIELS